jgi:hypothetical protein
MRAWRTKPSNFLGLAQSLDKFTIVEKCIAFWAQSPKTLLCFVIRIVLTVTKWCPLNVWGAGCADCILWRRLAFYSSRNSSTVTFTCSDLKIAMLWKSCSCRKNTKVRAASRRLFDIAFMNDKLVIAWENVKHSIVVRLRPVPCPQSCRSGAPKGQRPETFGILRGEPDNHHLVNISKTPTIISNDD